jgi:hypothetical protein
VNQNTKMLLFLGVAFLLVVIASIWRYRHPPLYAANVVAPGNRFNRIQRTGLIYATLGIVLTAGIQIINSFHPMDPNFRAGELGGSEGFILIGVVFFLIGWNRRRKPDGSSLG